MASSEIPPELEAATAETNRLVLDFLAALNFIVLDTKRDPAYFETHLLSYAAEDFLQGVIAIPVLVEQGIHNTCNRELRFLLELSIKLAFIQQQGYSEPIAQKLAQFRKIVGSSNISIKKKLCLDLLPSDARGTFKDEVGRIYGEASNYAHWSATQISQRVKRIKAGRTAGFENEDDVRRINLQIARGLSAILVLLYHSVPEYVAGDWFVARDGSSPNWCFSASRYLAYIDQSFDYKTERQAVLDNVKSKRWANIQW